jgi:NADH:ubiquinone oxidoreductase subunit K
MIAEVSSYLLLSSMLFGTGLVLLLMRKHLVQLLMGLELILNAANLNLVAFGAFDEDWAAGNILTLFVMVVAVAEAAIALALVLALYRQYRSASVEDIFKQAKHD